MDDLPKIKRFITAQIQQIKNIISLDDKQKLVERRLNPQERNELITHLDLLIKNRDAVVRKIKDIKIENLIL